MELTRRNLLKMVGVAALGATVGQFSTQHVEAAKKITQNINSAPVVGSKNVTGTNFSGSAAKVYFTKKIDAENLIKLYKMVNTEIIGNFAA